MAKRARLPVVPFFFACFSSQAGLMVPFFVIAPARFACARRAPGFVMAPLIQFFFRVANLLTPLPYRTRAAGVISMAWPAGWPATFWNRRRPYHCGRASIRVFLSTP